MKEMGFSPATIGMLLAIGAAVGAPASLAAGWWTRLVGNERRAALVAVAMSLAAIGLTPLFGSLWMFAIAISVHGFGMAVSVPLIVVLLSTGIPPHEQGVTAALRATANRVAAFVVPPVMGVVVQLTDIGSAFLVIGVVLVGLTLVLDRAFRRV
jgi:MFS family permease